MKKIIFLVFLITLGFIFPHTVLATDECTVTVENVIQGNPIIVNVVNNTPNTLKIGFCIHGAPWGRWISTTTYCSPLWDHGVISKNWDLEVPPGNFLHFEQPGNLIADPTRLPPDVNLIQGSIEIRSPRQLFGSGELLCDTTFLIAKTQEILDKYKGTILTLLKPQPCGLQEIKGPSGEIEKTTPAGIQTALGCIPTEPGAFINTFLSWAIGVAGGIAFLFMLWAALQILMSTGDPEKLKAGQEQLTAAIIGLLFIIFSVFLLKIIGMPIMFISGS